MSIDLEELSGYQDNINDLKEKKANIEGQVESSMQILKEDFGLASVKQAEKALEKLKKSGKKAKKAFEKLKEQLDQLHDWEEEDD